jgi:phospholipid/cholesterol/gamma-HCH transport system substrate-binding protein
MRTTTVRIQLWIFVAVSLAALVYGVNMLFPVARIANPPYLVEAQFKYAGGIHERADVDLLGTPVGTVREIRPGPGSGTTVVLAIDHAVTVSEDVTATIGSKSAIGEQYVELTPHAAGDPFLGEGDIIPINQTVSPPDVAKLLFDLNGLAKSVPTRDLAVALEEMTTAVEGVGPALGRALDDSAAVTREALDNVGSLTSLIDSTATVLDTQVETGPQTATYSGDLAGLTDRLRELNGSFDSVFTNGIRASAEITNLLRDNQAAIPVLLNHLVSLTTVGSERIPALRKALVVFPWVLEESANVIRYCDAYDVRTGKPIQKTCHYDDLGHPIYSVHLAQALEQPPGAPPYRPCTRGYEATRRYEPNGVPVGGAGRKQRGDSEPNPNAGCLASPTDPVTPNVHGAQNAQLRTGFAPRGGGLGWLLTQPLSTEE